MCSDGEPTAKYLTKGIFPTQPGLTALTQKTDLTILKYNLHLEVRNM